MNRLREIAERLAEIDTTLRALHNDIGDRPTTARQQERWDSLESERDELVTERNQLEARMDRIRRVAENPDNTEHGDDRSGRRRPELAPGEGQVVGEALRAIERAVGVPDHAKQAATALVESERSHPGLGVSLAARWALAAADPDYEAAWLSQLIDPERGHLSWSEAQRAAWARAEVVQRAMSVGTAASGGHMVPLTLDPALVLTSAGAAGNPVRAAARKVTTVTNEWRGVTTAGVSASWDAEASEVSDDSPTLAQPAIPVHKLAIFVPYSIEAEQDIPGLVDELRQVMEDERNVAEALAFTTGSGVGQPRGFVTALDGTASEVAPVTPETFVVADIYRTIEALPPRHRPNASWMSNLAVANDIRQFDSTGGADLWARLTGDTPDRLVGKPWMENSHMDDGFNPAVTADNFLLVVANWTRYVCVDRVGATAEIVSHLMGANRRPTGQRGLYFFTRVGGDVIDVSAFRILNVSTTV